MIDHYRKLTISIILCLVGVVSGKAQFVGNFGEGDPDAWFDKETFFVCYNQTPYAWNNVSLVLNDSKVYTYPYTWYSGYYLSIGKGNGVSLSAGDKVSLWVGNQCAGTWFCPKNPSYRPRVKGGGKMAGKILRKAWKYVKRVR